MPRGTVGRTPADNARRLAAKKAVNWVRESWPDVWDGFLTEAYDELGEERWPVGRPPGGIRKMAGS